MILPKQPLSERFPLGRLDNKRPHHTAAVAVLAHGAWRRRARRRRPGPAAVAVGGAAGSVSRRRFPPPLRHLFRRRPRPPRHLRRQPVAYASSEEVREAVRCLRGEGQLLVQALQGQRHHRVVSDARPGVRESVPLPYLRWDSGAALLELPGKWLRLKKRCQFSLSMIDGCWGVGKRVWNQLKLKGFCWDFVSRQKIAVSTQLKMRDNG
uniref:Uncharacterized protein n=1 Tax=Zea mays TaxID=4577 RepID=A0A804NI09_MAIZE